VKGLTDVQNMRMQVGQENQEKDQVQKSQSQSQEEISNSTLSHAA
jgi:hypothetical protein